MKLIPLLEKLTIDRGLMIDRLSDLAKRKDIKAGRNQLAAFIDTHNDEILSNVNSEDEYYSQLETYFDQRYSVNESSDKGVSIKQYLGNGMPPSLSVKALGGEGNPGLFFTQYQPSTHMAHMADKEDRTKYMNSHNAALKAGYKPTYYKAGKYGGVYLYQKGDNALTKDEFNSLSGE